MQKILYLNYLLPRTIFNCAGETVVGFFFGSWKKNNLFYLLNQALKKFSILHHLGCLRLHRIKNTAFLWDKKPEDVFYVLKLNSYTIINFCNVFCLISWLKFFYALHTATFSNNKMRSIIKFGFYMLYNYTKFNSLPVISIVLQK